MFESDLLTVTHPVRQHRQRLNDEPLDAVFLHICLNMQNPFAPGAVRSAPWMSRLLTYRDNAPDGADMHDKYRETSRGGLAVNVPER